MLLKQAILDGIARGDITRAFRRWRRPTVKAGAGLRTSVGVIRICALELVDEAGIVEADAHAAGFASLADLRRELSRHDGSGVYRISFDGIEPDARISLRETSDLSEADWHSLFARFQRWESAVPGYYPSILRLIGQWPGVPAGALADKLGVEKLKFKRDVRKLKELGLTESLEVGYRLSPRGSSALEKLRGHGL